MRQQSSGSAVYCTSGRALLAALRMRASPLVLTVVLACAHGKRGGLRQKARRVEAVEAAEAAAAAAAGEAIDPLGYYRYRWQQPTDRHATLTTPAATMPPTPRLQAPCLLGCLHHAS